MLYGANIRPKIVTDPVGSTSYAGIALAIGVVKSLSPSSATTTVTETGIGSIVKKRLSAQEFNFGWEGLITEKSIFNAGLPLDNGIPLDLDVYMHTQKFTGAKVETMTISGSEGEALRYSLAGKILGHETVAVADEDSPDSFFVMSDGIITVNGNSSKIIKSFELNVSRTINFVYGTSLSPVSLDVGTTNFAGTLEVAADGFEETMEGAVAAGASSFTITLAFTNPISSETFTLTCSSCQFNSAEGAVDPDSSLIVTKAFEYESMAVA